MDTSSSTMTAPVLPGEKRRRSEAEPPPSIPDDLLFSEVLPRLPIKSLILSKSVCRAWHDAIGSPTFARRHLDLSSSSSSITWPPAMLVVPRESYHLDAASKSSELSFYRLQLGEPSRAGVELVFEKTWPEGVTHAIVPTHCDGLVAIAKATGEVFVCNPATSEFVALPPGTRSVFRGVVGAPPAVALGYDTSRERYVVARYFYRTYNETVDVDTGELLLQYDIGHEVFTLGDGGDNTWEVTDDPPRAIADVRPICTTEAFHWCAETQQPQQSVLIRFGLRDRVFDVVPCPRGLDFHYDADHVGELGGKLCCVHPAVGSDTVFDVWVAEDDGSRWPEWSLRCRVDLEDNALGGEAFLPLSVAGDEMLIAVDYKRVYVYDERLRSLRLVVDMEEELEYERMDGSLYDDGDLLQHHVVPYVESLVSIRARQCSKVG